MRLLFLVAILAFSVAQACQSIPNNYMTWREAASGQTGNVRLGSGKVVKLDQSVTLSGGLIIDAGASLWFDWTQDIKLQAEFIEIIDNGQLYIGTEACPFEKKATIVLTGNIDRPIFGRRALGVGRGGVLELHGSKGLNNTWTTLATSASAGSQSITVTEEVGSKGSASWAVGDQIVICTSDYDWMQSEERKITSINGKQIQLDRPLSFFHFGQESDGIDMRAEVALLTRNIVIQDVSSPNTDPLSVGPHLKVVQHFQAVHVEGVECDDCSQDLIGVYPFHFHLARNAPQGTYLRHNSIVRSHFRAITIHGTSNVDVVGNVAYDVYGHAFFFEDGVEINNKLHKNLAISVRPKDNDRNWAARLGSDMSTGLSCFWLTNPNNEVTENRCVGTRGVGFWYVVREGPDGVAKEIADSNPSDEWNRLPAPYKTPLKKFSHNRVHSARGAVQMESRLFDFDDRGFHFPHSIVQNLDCRNPDNTRCHINIDHGVYYKCFETAIWARMGNLHVRFSKFADNNDAIQLATTGGYPLTADVSYVEDCLIVGTSANPTRDMAPLHLQRGWTAYDGPHIFIRTTFKNFGNKNDGSFWPSAIGTRWVNEFQMATTTAISGSCFINVTKRFWTNDCSCGMKQSEVWDGGRTLIVRDVDGSISGYPHMVMLPKYKFYETDECVEVSGTLACPHKYVTLYIEDQVKNEAGKSFFGPASHKPGVLITRANHVGQDHTAYQLPFSGEYRVVRANLAVGASYLVQFTAAPLPRILQLQLVNADENDALRVAVCYDPATEIVSVKRVLGTDTPVILASSTLSQASSFQDARIDSGDAYYWDRSRGIMFVGLKQRSSRNENGVDGEQGNFCPSSGCERVVIEVRGSLNFNNCLDSAFRAPNSIQVESGAWLNTPRPAPSAPPCPEPTG